MRDRLGECFDFPELKIAALHDPQTEGLLIDSDLVVSEHSEEGTIPFEVHVGDLTLAYEASVEDGALVHRALANEAYVVRERSEPQPLSAF